MKFEEIKYMDRKSGKLLKEKVPGEAFLEFLYYNPFGRLSLEVMVKRKFMSSFYGWLMDRKFSRNKIASFVKEHGIDMGEAKKGIREFTSFNDFFCRELREGTRPVEGGERTLSSPADGKALAFENIRADKKFVIKGFDFTLGEFLRDEQLAKKYEGGIMIIIRLAPADYHRFHFPTGGEISENKKIAGSYYSVSPHALKRNTRVFCENKREYSVLKSGIFGEVVICEIGATMVGSIYQTYREGSLVKKGEEKGYFSFGGSTVVLLLEKGKLNVDNDILKNSSNCIETKVKFGQRLGVGVI